MLRSLLWFKQDLRLDDHPALQAAAAADELLAVYVLDPQLFEASALGHVASACTARAFSSSR